MSLGDLMQAQWPALNRFGISVCFAMQSGALWKTRVDLRTLLASNKDLYLRLHATVCVSFSMGMARKKLENNSHSSEPGLQ